MSAIGSERLLGPEDLAARLAAGEAVLFPTDTLPALAARPVQAAELWRLKRRPADKPLILMGADLEQLQGSLGLPWRPEWLAMAEQGWPGALTLVLPAHGPTLQALHPGGMSLGLRVPACPMVQDLLRSSGPLATTSANLSGEQPAATAEDAASMFPGLALLGPLPWPEGGGQASTVLAWQQSDAALGDWQVLRAGVLLPAGI
jgi:L-threonylcarbamoyladenylate synthase